MDLSSLHVSLTCHHHGCEIIPVWGCVMGRPKFCTEHKSDEMRVVFTKENFADVDNIDLTRGWTQCKGVGCDRGSSFNFPGFSPQRLVCARHKLEMMDGNRNNKCVNCKSKTALFNFRGEKMAYCSDCKSPGMIYLKTKLCIICNTTHPSFNYPGLSPAYCKACKLPNMICVKKKKCAFHGCNTSPYFNFPSETGGLYCNQHRKPGMINLYSKKCQICKTKECRYNYPDLNIASHCGDCKLPGMIDIKTKRCQVCNLLFATCRMPGGNVNTHCGQCKTPEMEYQFRKICKTESCPTVAQNKYDGYCLRCFIFNNPDADVAKNYKIKEQHVFDFIKQHFSNYKPVFCRKISGGCSRRMPDVFIDLLTHCVIVEIDEHGHPESQYSSYCESVRINEIFTDLGDRPLIIIRFNPDGYKDKEGIKHKSCFGTTKKRELIKIIDKEKWNARLERLKSSITHSIENIPEEYFEIIPLYYNGC